MDSSKLTTKMHRTEVSNVPQNVSITRILDLRREALIGLVAAF